MYFDYIKLGNLCQYFEKHLVNIAAEASYVK